MNAAEPLINTLVELGVTTFFLAPGSRSTPLVTALSQQNGTSLFIHFDERGLAFQALGFAKVTRLPVAIIVTSGTAVANLMPAVMEASNAHVPLLLITADRPFELRDCGANQAADQVKLFAPFVRWQADLPTCDPDLPVNALSHVVSYAVHRAKAPDPGPVHLNCMFREPFFPEAKSPPTYPVHYEEESCLPSEDSFNAIASKLKRLNRGVIVAGSGAFQEYSRALSSIARKLGWPILTDPLSGVRQSYLEGHIIPYTNLILKRGQVPKPDAVIHLGERLVSHTLSTWLQAAAPAYYLHISPHTSRFDPSLRVTDHIRTDPKVFCEKLLVTIASHHPVQDIEIWKEEASHVSSHLRSFFENKQELSELSLIDFLLGSLPSSWALFVGNSMPIRDIDTLFYPKTPPSAIVTNRGVSGIDGNLATACGVAEGLRLPVLAVLGDLTFLHDLNSLALVRSASVPIIILVINNGGGGIFSFLPEITQRPDFEKSFATVHPYTFESAATLFKLPYSYCDSLESLSKCFDSLYRKPRTMVLEIETNREENLSLHKQIFAVHDSEIRTF